MKKVKINHYNETANQIHHKLLVFFLFYFIYTPTNNYYR